MLAKEPAAASGDIELDERGMISMKNTHVRIRDLQPYPQVPAKVAGRATPIERLFVELVEVLERFRENSQPAPAGSSLECWEDGEFIYLEADLGAIFESEIDINVHDGRLYAHIER